MTPTHDTYPRFTPHDAVEQAELLVQQRASKSRLHRWLKLACFGLIVFAFVWSVLIAVLTNNAGPYNPQLVRIEPSVERVGVLSIGLPMLLLVILHVLTLIRTLNMAASAISREKEGRTWESLILTGISAGRIVRGKWLAALKTIWREYRYVFGLRAVFTLLLWLFPSWGLRDDFPVVSLLVGLLASVTIPALYVAFAAAVGILVSTANRRVIAAMITAWGVYFTLIGTLFATINMNLRFLLFYGITTLDYASYQAVIGWELSVFDGGLLIARSLADVSIGSAANLRDSVSNFPMLLSALSFAPVLAFVVLIVAMLGLAQFLLWRQITGIRE